MSVYEIDAAVSQGMSGGPTVNYQGEVVGTNSFKPPEEDQRFNFVSQIARVHELLASQTTLDYRAGIDAFFAGDKEEAIRLLTRVTQEQPANGMASDYLARARALPDPPPEQNEDPSGMSTWIIAAIAAGALLLLGAALLGPVLARRKREAPAASTGDGTAHPLAGPTSPAPAPRPVAVSNPGAHTRPASAVQAPASASRGSVEAGAAQTPAAPVDESGTANSPALGFRPPGSTVPPPQHRRRGSNLHRRVTRRSSAQSVASPHPVGSSAASAGRN